MSKQHTYVQVVYITSTKIKHLYIKCQIRFGKNKIISSIWILTQSKEQLFHHVLHLFKFIKFLAMENIK
jgi:hypothetical protein